ncbi:MAG: TolC family protein [SAR324 cluster bacterium]|nr:TolC family protein [SAR324 cluster bacterium]
MMARFTLSIQGWMFAILCCTLCLSSTQLHAQESPKTTVPRLLNLEQCLQIALENNRLQSISQENLRIAEAQRQQAISSYWPQLNFSTIAMRLDETPNFVFPASTFQSVPIQFGGASIDMPPVDVPGQDVKLMDRDIILSSLNLMYPLYTGGKISSINTQAEMGLKIAQMRHRQTNLKLVYDVKRMFYGTLLTAKLQRIADQILQRFKTNLELTKKLFHQGSGSVQKTDYLKLKVIVSSLHSMREYLIANHELARSALVMTLGLDWQTPVNIREQDFPFEPDTKALPDLIAGSYEFSPDWNQVQYGLQTLEAKLEEAQSGHLPVIALTGKLHHIENSYDSGIMTSKNRDGWQIGIVLNFPLFAGFRTSHEVAEAQARLDQLRHQKILLHDGLVLQVKQTFLEIQQTQKQVIFTQDAWENAREHLQLNERGYQNDLLPIDDVIGAQVMAAMTQAQYLKTLHDHVLNRAKLGMIIGNEIAGTLE